MSRQLACLAAALLAAACTPDDATAPTAGSQSGPASPLYISRDFYRASVLPLRYAAAINGSGAVVGSLPNGWGAYYADGVTTVLPLPPDGSVTSVSPVDVLDDGRILANGDRGYGANRTLYYASSTSAPIVLTVAGEPDATVWARAMNGEGVVVGSCYSVAVSSERAFRWTAGGGFADITPAHASEARATDIAESGEIIGTVGHGPNFSYRWDAGGASGTALPSGVWGFQALNGGSVLARHPTFGYAVWSPSAITPAGPDPKTYFVTRISPSGRLVGWYRDPVSGQQRPWTSIGSGTAATLPLPAGFVSAYPVDVNACGAIIGRGFASDGSERAIKWSRGYTCDWDAPPPPVTSLPAFTPA